MPRRAAVRSRGGPQSRFAAEARVRLRALRSPRPGVLTIACRTRAAQALAKVKEWDTKKTGKHTRSDVIGLLTTRRFLRESTARRRRAASPGRRNVTIRCGGAGSRARAAAWTRSRRCSTTSTTWSGPTPRGRGEPLAGGRALSRPRHSAAWPRTLFYRSRSDSFPLSLLCL